MEVITVYKEKQTCLFKNHLDIRGYETTDGKQKKYSQVATEEKSSVEVSDRYTPPSTTACSVLPEEE